MSLEAASPFYQAFLRTHAPLAAGAAVAPSSSFSAASVGGQQGGGTGLQLLCFRPFVLPTLVLSVTHTHTKIHPSSPIPHQSCRRRKRPWAWGSSAWEAPPPPLPPNPPPQPPPSPSSNHSPTAGPPPPSSSPHAGPAASQSSTRAPRAPSGWPERWRRRPCLFTASPSHGPCMSGSSSEKVVLSACGVLMDGWILLAGWRTHIL